ncbi:MAG: HAMP domain-containing sensor histidine kinase [Pseudomonadota bacterium]
MFLKSIAGRFILLTIIFVMLAEVLIFVPSLARFRVQYLEARLERAQIASLSVLASPQDMLDPELEEELLRNAEVLNVVLRRNEIRQLVLSSPMAGPVEESFDLRDTHPVTLIFDAFDALFRTEDRVIRVVGVPVNAGGELIDISLYEKPLRDEMWIYGRNITYLSITIALMVSVLFYFATQYLLVRPNRRLIEQVKGFHEAPDDSRQILVPSSMLTEVYEAEVALANMQTDLNQALRQKERLALLGGAVSKISHDLRNMLTTAQLLADGLEASKDPRVKRSAPRIINSVSRAVDLCERTLTFGKAEEPEPVLSDTVLLPLLNDVAEAERLAIGDKDVDIIVDATAGLTARIDADQLYRVISNLVRNARQVLTARSQPGRIEVIAQVVSDRIAITIKDNGPGLPEKAREKLFKPFEGGVRAGGSGLGLAISQELVRNQGGEIRLIKSDENGATFEVTLPGPND